MNKAAEELRAAVERTVERGLTDEALAGFRKTLDKAAAEAHESLIYSIHEETAAEIAGAALDMADRSVKALLAGNDEEVRRYLGCPQGGWTGRSDSPQWGRERKAYEWWPVIHGNLHEGAPAALRRRIVDAHSDLIKDQRILDLEDQVKSLTALVNKEGQENERVREGF